MRTMRAFFSCCLLVVLLPQHVLAFPIVSTILSQSTSLYDLAQVLNVSTELGQFVRGGETVHEYGLPNTDHTLWRQHSSQAHPVLFLHPQHSQAVGSGDSGRTWFEFQGPFCADPDWHPVRLTTNASIFAAFDALSPCLTDYAGAVSARVSTDIVHRQLQDFSPVCHHLGPTSTSGSYCLDNYPYWKDFPSGGYPYQDPSDPYCKTGQPTCIWQHPHNVDAWSFHSFALDEVCPEGFQGTRLEDILFMPQHTVGNSNGVKVQVLLDETVILAPQVLLGTQFVAVDHDIVPGTRTVSFGVHNNGVYWSDHLLHVNPTVVCQRSTTSATESRLVALHDTNVFGPNHNMRTSGAIELALDPATEFIAFSTHTQGTSECDWAQFEHPVIECQRSEQSIPGAFFEAKFAAVHSEIQAHFNAAFSCQSANAGSNVAKWCSLLPSTQR